MAAKNRIRGITLEINGDTTGLSDALKGVNRQIAGTQTTLKDVDKLLQLDPKNTELLSQKQKLLAQAVENTREKLQTLKQASEEAAKSAVNYDAWKEKYEPLKKQIDETSDSLRELRQKAADAKEQFEGGKISETQYKAIQEELADTSVKLKDLKEQKKALDEEFGNPISPDQYDALQRELIQTEQDLQKLETAADNTGKELDELDESADDLNVSFGSMVKNKVIDVLGDALMDIGRKAVDAAKYCLEVGSSFGSAMSKVKATSGASSGAMSRLAEKAKEMGSKTKFSATEAGEAMNYMAMAGWKTEDMLSGVEGVMNLAAASGEDLATTSDIVTDALTAFGKSSKESGRLADIMAAASSNANTNVGMMGETFKYAAPIAGALGYSMEDTAVAIGLMANAGIKASQAGTSIRSGLTRLAAPTKQVTDAMNKYGISLTDNDGKMLSFRDMMIQLREKLGGLGEAEQTAAASALFGKNAMSGWLAVINGSDADFDKLTNAIDNSNGSAERMAETMQDNLSGKLTILNSALEGLGIAVYEYVSGPLQSTVEFVTGIIGGITEAIKPQRTELESFIDDIGSANEEVRKSIERANATFDNTQAEVAQMEASKSILEGILDNAEKVNEIDLGNGKTAIVNAAGEIVSFGFAPVKNAAGEAADEIEKINVVEVDGSGIEKSLETVVTYFDPVTEKVTEVRGSVDEFGKSEIDTSGIIPGTEVVIETFDNVGTSVGNAKGTIDEFGNVRLDTGATSSIGNIALAFDKLSDSASGTAETVYRVTDEFQKYQTSNLVSSLSNIIPQLTEAWDEQSGVLRTNKTDLEEWFKTAEAIMMKEALMERQAELIKAQTNAMIDQAMAVSAVQKAEEALADFNETNGSKSEMAIMNPEGWAAAKVALEDTLKTAQGEADKAAESLETASEGVNAFNDVAEEMAATVGMSKDEFLGLSDAEETAGQTGEDAAKAANNLAEGEAAAGEAAAGAADNVEKLTQKQQEAIDKLAEFYNATDSDLAGIRDMLGMSNTDFADWADSIVKNNEEITQSFDSLLGKLTEQMASFALDTTGDGSPLDNIQHKLEQDNVALRNWIEDMSVLREQLEQGNLRQDVYDAIVEMGPEKGAEAAAAFAEGFETENYEQIDKINGEISTRLNLAEDAALIASATSTGKAWAGVTAEHTVADLTNLANGVIAETALGAGQQTSENIAAGLTSSSGAISDAATGAVTEANTAAETEAQNAATAGEQAAASTASGIESAKDQVKTATEGMIDDANKAGELIALQFNVTGQVIPQELERGINKAIELGLGPVPAIKDMMADALEAVNAVIPDMEEASRRIVDALTSATNNFTWTLPSPKIPHIKWDWNRIDYGDGQWFEVPDFSVEWYAKAMERGMILDRPTIFGAMDGRLLAGGEAGSETVVGTSSLMEMIQQAVSRAQQAEANINNFGGVTVNVYGHEGQDIRQLADEIEYRIALNVRKKEAGFA